MFHPIRISLILIIVFFLSSCSSKTGKIGATPKQEALSPYGNPKNYNVFGKKYHIRNTSKGYKEIGYASWYGNDFHGKRTSSGTPYNMHAYSAAHKTLPIPTYVLVTNLENNKQIIVRVDDRGPFAKNRIIDLSFVAAKELEITQKGTARVKVEAVEPYQHLKNYKEAPKIESIQAPRPQLAQNLSNPVTIEPQNQGYAIQLGAFSSQANAENHQQTIQHQVNQPLNIRYYNGLYRVCFGDFNQKEEAYNASLQLGLPSTIIFL